LIRVDEHQINKSPEQGPVAVRAYMTLFLRSTMEDFPSQLAELQKETQHIEAQGVHVEKSVESRERPTCRSKQAREKAKHAAPSSMHAITMGGLTLPTCTVLHTYM